MNAKQCIWSYLASEETKQKLDFGKQYNSIINIVFNKTSHIWDLSEGHFFRLHNYEIWILREVHSYDQLLIADSQNDG